MEKTRLKGLTAKIETVFKQDAMPAPETDGIQLEDNIWASIEWGFLEENLRPQLAQLGFGRTGGARPSGRFCHITAPVAFKGTAAALTDANRPELDVLLRIAAHQATVDATVGMEAITYTPRSSGFESATVYAYSSGSLFKVAGARATLSQISILPNQIVRFVFDIWGVLKDDPSDVALPSIDYPHADVEPPVAKDEGLTLAGFDPAGFSTATFEQRLQLPAKQAGNDPDGHAGYEPTDWDPHFRTTIAKPPKASFDYVGLRSAGTRFAWDIGPIGSANYNRLTLSGPSARIVEGPHSDQDGFAMVDLLMRCENSNPGSQDAYEIKIH